ncbi:MAG TPA: hypothetical protein VLE53_07315 [Gemmatimonadaceae bacterium]|nr:hypothetical protein [Gemmatimonadaceae bacterium]
MDALRERTLWISVERTRSGGRACRDLTVRDSSGTALLVARAFPWQRDIVVCRADRPNAAWLVVRRRRSFPLTGKVDVVDVANAARIGILNRSGRVRNARGALLGRFADARSGKRRVVESLVEGVGNAIVGGDSTGSMAASTREYTYAREGRVIGRLTRGRPPFAVAPARSSSSPLSRVAHLLPARLRAALLDAQPSGWEFVREETVADDDPRLPVAAALFVVELSHW